MLKIYLVTGAIVRITVYVFTFPIVLVHKNCLLILSNGFTIISHLIVTSRYMKLDFTFLYFQLFRFIKMAI